MQFEFTAKEIEGQKVVSWIQPVNPGADLLQEGKDYILRRFSEDYILLKIKLLDIKCSGCLEDQPNQLAHMDCPNGCLHDPKECGCS